MAATVVVVVLEAAAEAYGKQLAMSVGEGIVETLFRQEQIASDLNEIKKQLAALSDFIRNKLPTLIERSVDLAFARKAEFDVAEKARTISGGIATLRQALKDGAPDANLQFLVSELAGHADAIFEIGGALIAYGQPYYASVGVAFGAGLKAYSTLVSVAPERFQSLKNRASDWKFRLQPWLDAARPSSLSGSLMWWESRYALGLKTVPSFETWNTHTTREVVISWTKLGGNVFVNGAWFGYWRDKGLQGDTLGRWLKPGQTFEQARAKGELPYTLPEWWTIRADVPASKGDYEQCAYLLSTLIHDYYLYQEIAPTMKKAVAIVNATMAALEKILSVSDDATSNIQPSAAENVLTAEQQSKQVETTLSLNLPGIGITRRF